MKLTCDGRQLAEAMRLTSLVSQRRESRILLKAEGDTLHVFATTGDRFISVDLPVRAEVPGKVLVDPTLSRLLHDGEVVLDGDPIPDDYLAGLLHFAQGNAEGEVKAWPDRSFPAIPEAPFPMQPCASLLEATHTVSPFCATEESRPVLTCVKVQPVEGGTSVAAADGFRLGVYRVPETYPEMLIPVSLLALVDKAFDPNHWFGGYCLLPSETIPTFGISGSVVTFRAGGVTVGGDLYQGNFPDYFKLIPQGGSPVKFDLPRLREAVERMAQIDERTPDSSHPTVRLEAKDGQLRVWAKQEEVAKLSIILPAEGECQIAFNARYLLDGLRALSTGAVMETTSLSSAALFKGDGPLTYVLMPTWTQW